MPGANRYSIQQYQTALGPAFRGAVSVDNLLARTNDSRETVQQHSKPYIAACSMRACVSWTPPFVALGAHLLSQQPRLLRVAAPVFCPNMGEHTVVIRTNYAYYGGP